MITVLDKAIVAAIMAILSILNLVFDLGVREEVVGVVIAVLTPLLVYFVPNRTSTS